MLRGPRAAPRPPPALGPAVRAGGAGGAAAAAAGARRRLLARGRAVLAPLARPGCSEVP